MTSPTSTWHPVMLFKNAGTVWKVPNRQTARPFCDARRSLVPIAGPNPGHHSASLVSLSLWACGGRGSLDQYRRNASSCPPHRGAPATTSAPIAGGTPFPTPECTKTGSIRPASSPERVRDRCIAMALGCTTSQATPRRDSQPLRSGLILRMFNAVRMFNVLTRSRP